MAKATVKTMDIINFIRDNNNLVTDKDIGRFLISDFGSVKWFEYALDWALGKAVKTIILDMLKAKSLLKKIVIGIDKDVITISSEAGKVIYK